MNVQWLCPMEPYWKVCESLKTFLQVKQNILIDQFTDHRHTHRRTHKSKSWNTFIGLSWFSWVSPHYFLKITDIFFVNPFTRRCCYVVTSWTLYFFLKTKAGTSVMTVELSWAVKISVPCHNWQVHSVPEWLAVGKCSA